MNHQVIILGGGISGRSTAWKLAQRGCPVTVLEADNSCVSASGFLDQPPIIAYTVAVGCCNRWSVGVVFQHVSGETPCVARTMRQTLPRKVQSRRPPDDTTRIQAGL